MEAVRQDAMAQVQCVNCKEFTEALDPNIKAAYLGYCMKHHWPFKLMVPLEGFAENCPLYQSNG